MAWEVVRRGTPNKSGANASVVTIRRNAIAFSAFFIRSHNLNDMTNVTIHQDRERRRLGFLFHKNGEEQDCLILAGDGGGQNRNKGGRSVQTSNLMRQPWIRAILANRSNRRFIPHKESNLWVIDLGPGFEVEVNHVSDVPAEVTGVYRYLDGEEVTYIGRGRVRDRIQQAHRETWQFDRIQYSPMNDREAEQRWEQILLEEYETKHGRLPRENRVRGYVPALAPEEG